MTSIFRRDFPSFQCASTASHNPCATNHGNCPIHPFYLLLYFGTMLKKHFVNPLSQVHKCFNGHP